MIQPSPQEKPGRITDWLTAAGDHFGESPRLFLGAGALALGLTVASAGLLIGPATVGMVRIVLDSRDPEAPRPRSSQVFGGFRRFLPAFLYGLTLLVAGGLAWYRPIAGPSPGRPWARRWPWGCLSR